ncbi:AKTIP [Cordylochernes scorpioides]|uniref:AKTIP n=1 Tax=Cordylochernes scorpioides TaxID=51811 RepID=A0ABY6LNC1_9ARAC|nr:AKTIP [Cordylochernes scorpioides]
MSFLNKMREDSKKILPSVPTEGVKVLERSGTESKFPLLSYGPFFLEYSLMSEYVLLHKQRLSGVYVVPGARTPLKWYGVLFIRQGLYVGGVFKFVLHIPENYPDCDCPPTLVFDPPRVPPSHQHRNWRDGRPAQLPQVEVLLFARKMFYHIDTQSPFNPEAAVIYEKDHNLFQYKVSKSISTCMAKIYDNPPSADDPHAIRFSPWDSSVHEEVRQTLTMQKRHPDIRNVGMSSWVQNGGQQRNSPKPSS